MRRKVGFVARSLVLVKSNSNQKLEKFGLPSRTRPIASKIVCHLSSVIAIVIVIVIVRPSFWISHDDAEGRGTIEKTTSVADAESVAEAESVADAEAESVAVA
jgi:hypothetical protein